MGSPCNDDRLVLHGILRILSSAALWRDLPECFGPWSTPHQRFHDWCDDGTLERVLESPHIWLNREGMINSDTWINESTAVRAT
ncbi:MAG: ISPs1, transposase OrfA [Pseudomonas sp.]|nr:ISPs1, transposase OrfA [Pseudomonas sp.]